MMYYRLYVLQPIINRLRLRNLVVGVDGGAGHSGYWTVGRSIE